MFKRLALPLVLASPAVADAPSVVTDIAPVHSLVSMVMGDLGQPDMLIDPSASPHHANLRPSQAASLQDAGLIIMIGEELTPWLTERTSALAGETKVVTLLDLSPVLIEPGEGEADHDDHAEEHGDHEGHDHDKEHDHGEEHAHEDEHGHDDHDDHKDDDAHAEEEGHDDHGHEGEHAHDHAIDPHAWLDPQNALAWLGEIAGALATADPENASTYQENAEKGRAVIAEVMAEVTASLGAQDGNQYIAYHDAYSYFSNRWDYRSAGSLASNEGVTPSAADIKAARALIEGGDITCVFTEAQYNADIVATTVEGFSVNTAELDPLGASLPPGADLYPSLLKNVAETFKGCVG